MPIARRGRNEAEETPPLPRSRVLGHAPSPRRGDRRRPFFDPEMTCYGPPAGMASLGGRQVTAALGALLGFVLVRDHVWWPARERGPSGDARFPAAAAALFFALAPLNTQPVDYVWARSALLSTTLYLGAFLAFLRRRWTLGAVLFALALLTKAIAVTLPAMLLIHDFVYRDRTRYRSVTSYLGDWRRLVLPVLLPAALALAYVAYRSAVLPSWTAETRQQAWVTPRIWFMSQWSALLYYVRLFVWPNGLSADHDFPYTPSLLAARAWLPLLVLVAW